MRANGAIRKRAISAAVGLLGASATAAHGAVALQLAWSREYGAETKFWYAHRTAALSGQHIVVGGQREDHRGASTEAWLLEVDANGELVAQQSAGADFQTVRALSSAGTYAVAVRNNGRLALLRRGGDDKIEPVAEIAAAATSPVIVRVVELAGQGSVAVGRDEQGAVAIGIGVDGAARWEKRPDGIRLETFLDAAPDGAGGFVVVGNSRLAEPAPVDFGSAASRGDSADPPTVWVGRYRGDGTQSVERRFAGRHGSIVRARAGGYALVYDRGQGAGQDIVVQRLSDDLGDLWSAPVFSTDSGYQYFRLALLASGDFVIVGGRDDQPYVALVSAAGQRTAEFVGTGLLRSESYQVVTSGDVIFVVSTVFVEFTQDGKRDAAQKVRVMRLEPKAT